MSGQANPLPKDGVVGKLTGEQNKLLKDFWREFLKLVDEAPEEGSGPKDTGGNNNEDVGDSPPKNVPKDDKAKEAAREEQEKKDAQAAFKEYGSKRFMKSFWLCVAMDDPDGIMLRFLRARKWKSGAGVAMIAACIKWRMSSDVEEIFRKGEEGMRNADGFIKQMDSGKTFTQGTDKYGRPVIYIHVAKHRTYDQSPKALEDFVLFQMESNRCLFSPPVDKVCIVFNMEKFGIRNMDWRCILFIVKCLEAYYPESLNVMLIHKAPWVFQGIWKMLAPMLDPVVRAKIQMTKNADDLLVHIPKNHLIKELGGSNEWEWKYPPIVEGENEKQKDKEGLKREQGRRDELIAEYIEKTRAWIDSDDVKVEKEREAVMLEMRAQYFELDDYIRGKGAYHRNGNIVGNGLVTFEYPAAKGEKGEAEWETQGYPMCREACLAKAERIRKEIGVEKKSGGSEPGLKRTKSKKEKSKSRKSDD